MSDLVVNGGMEAWTAGTPDSWTKTVVGASTVTQDTTDPHSGVSCALFNVDTGTQCQLMQTVAAVGNTAYTLSLWHKGNGTQTIHLRVIIQTGADAGKWLLPDGTWGTPTVIIVTAAAVWTQLSIPNTFPANSGNVDINVREYDGGTYSVRVDDVAFSFADPSGDLGGQRQQAVPFTRGAGGGGKI